MGHVGSRLVSAARAMIAALGTGFAAGVAACGGSPLHAATQRTASVVWIEDDYAAAMRNARETRRNVIALVGAAWCSSCRSARSVVLTDRALAGIADRYVWLAIDVERDASAAFRARYASDALPTTWVIDFSSGSAWAKWRGTLRLDDLARLATIASDASAHRPITYEASDALVRGLRAAAEGDDARAELAYRDGSKREAPPSEARDLAVQALLASLVVRGNSESCAEIAAREQGEVRGWNARVVVLALGLHCGAPLVEAARGALSTSAGSRDVLDDDRSALYGALHRALVRRGDGAVAKQIATEWVAFVEAARSRAGAPEARSALDGPLLDACVALGDPARALPSLAASARASTNYDAPARLAHALHLAGRLDEAIATLDRAIALAYGPRKIVVFAEEVDVQLERGNRDAARRALDAALILARSLPLEGSYAFLRAALEVRRAEWNRSQTK